MLGVITPALIVGIANNNGAIKKSATEAVEELTASVSDTMFLIEAYGHSAHYGIPSLQLEGTLT